MSKPNLKSAIEEQLAVVGGGQGIITPSGLHVSSQAFEGLVKAEAKREVKREKKAGEPQFFSEYALAQNMVAYGAREKPHDTPSFKDLQFAAKRSFVDAILIRARSDQFKMVWQPNLLGKQIGFKVVHDRHGDPDFKEDERTKERCIEMTKLINNPTPSEFCHLYPNEVRPHHNIKDLMSRLVRAELVIDRKCIYRYKRRNGKGFAAFHWVPGETIRPVHEAIRKWASKNGVKNIQAVTPMQFGQIVDRMSHATGFDIHNHDYVQIVDGRIVAAFTKDELAIHIANPSDEMNRFGYGESRLEISLDITASLVYAWRYNQELFKTNYPESVLMISGAYDKEGLQAFKQQILAEGGQIENNWRLPVISTASDAEAESLKIESHKLRDTPKDMLFDQFFRMMVALKCAAYGAHPTIINFSTDSGGGAGGLFGHNPSDEIEFSKEHGFKPAIMDMAEWMTEAIIKPNYDDLRLIITGLDEEDEAAALELLTKKGASYITRNEMRAMDNLEPIGDINDPDNPWNMPNDAPIPQYMQALASKQQMESMGGMDGMEGYDEFDQGGDQPDFDDGTDEQAHAPEPEAVQKSRHSGKKFFKMEIN